MLLGVLTYELKLNILLETKIKTEKLFCKKNEIILKSTDVMSTSSVVSAAVLVFTVAQF